jgi:hypothetical protein
METLHPSLFAFLSIKHHPMLIRSGKANLNSNQDPSGSNLDTVPISCIGISRKKYAL